MKTPLYLLTVFAFHCGSAAAQDSFTVAWSSISGGGGGDSTEPAEFTLAGSSVGQFSAGEPTGEPGEFSLNGGYWSFEFDPQLPDLHLAMLREGGSVTLTWDDGITPVVLESSADLELWAPVDPQPAGPPFVEPEGDRRYYRLSKP